MEYVLDFSIRTKELDRAVVSCEGELDVATSDRFREAIDIVIIHKPRDLLVDLSPLPFMGSAGVRLLQELSQRCRHQGTRLEVVVNEQERRLFEMTGIHGNLHWRPAS